MFVHFSKAAFLASVSLVTLALGCASARAGSVSWTGAANNNDWFDDANWEWGSGAPTAADDARIDQTGVVLTGQAGAAAEFFVGISNEADLAVQDGLTTTDASLGYNVGSTGTMTVSSSLGSWTNTGNTYIGVDGTGVVNVQTGSEFLGGVVYLGAGATGSGTLEVSNTSRFEAGDFYIGYAGSGSFVLKEASSAETGRTVIADGIGSSGDVTISTDSSWTLTDSLLVGGGGVGTLVIKEGAEVIGTSAAIGNGGGSAGSSVRVTGSGTSWTNTGQLIVGSFGDSTLEILAGAEVESDSAIIGRHSTSSVTVSGSGSYWDSGSLQIGGDRSDTSSTVAGDGSLEILAGAVVDTTTAILGDSVGSFGSVLVDGSGSLWELTDRLCVGGLGEGTLTITNAGKVTSAGGLIGHEAGSSGLVEISGDDSLWENTGVLYVGNLGDGKLNILAGGDVTSTDGYVGTEDGSYSTATVSGAGSTWINSGDFFVGHNDGATGIVTISAGGKIESVQGILGDLAGSGGSMQVTGDGSLWATSGDLNVGRFGAGDLAITLGGDVTAGRSLIGNEAGSEGVATVSGDGSTWVTSGDLYVANEGTGTLTIADGGYVSAAEITIANATGSTGKLIVGADLGEVAGGTGSLEADAIHFGDGDGSLVFNFGGADFAFDSEIDGDGEIALANGKVIYSGDGSAFLGTTDVTGGTLQVDGTLGGMLSVSGWGTLSGSGTVGSTTIASGATITPGGSGVATLTVDGNLSIDSGATYKVNVNTATGSSDLIHATGTASLVGGSVLHVGPSSGYALSQTYTILTADGGVTGTFDTVASSYAFLDADLGYDTNDVTLTLNRNSVAFAEVAKNENQSATAAGVESLGSGNTLYDALVVLDDGTAANAFQQLSGEVHSLNVGASFDNSRFVRTLGIDRVRSVFGNAGARAGGQTIALGSGSNGSGATGALAYGEEKPRAATAAEQATESILVDQGAEGAFAWAQAYGGWGRSFATDENAGLANSIGGLAFGIDTRLGDTTWQLGIMAGYGRASFEVNDGLSKGDSDDYDLGLYGGNQWGPVAFRFGALYKHQQVSTDRKVDFTGFSDRLSADYGTNTVQGFAELGYEVKVGDVRLEPFVNLAQVYMHTPAFTEQGGAAALARDASSMNVTLTNLGVHAATEIKAGGLEATLRGAVSWQHAFGDTDTLSTLSFAGGNDFVTSSKTIAENSLVLQAGVDWTLGEASTVGLSYNGNYSSTGVGQTVQLNYGRQF